MTLCSDTVQPTAVCQLLRPEEIWTIKVLQVGRVEEEQLELSAPVCPHIGVRLCAGQMGTKEAAVGWNYTGALSENVPG